MERKKKIKTVIVVLAVLLVGSLVALGATLLYNRSVGRPASTVTVPDNLITPDGDRTPSDSTENGRKTADADERAKTAAGKKKATTIELYNKQPSDNAAFAVGNMFPGDAVAKNFCVRVSYHDIVTVHFKAAVRTGYEKLAEVLQMRVKLPETGEILYDGLMSEMPKSVTYWPASQKTTTDEIYYEITAYLDTSVGNAYQNQNLIADFNWWVTETENLDNPPKTGDTVQVLLWILLAVCSGCLLIFLLLSRRRKEDERHV